MLTIAEQAARSMFASPSTRKKLLLSGSELVTEDGTERYRVIGARAFFIDVPAAATASDMAETYANFESQFSRLRRELRAKIFGVVKSRSARIARAEFERLTSGSFVLGVGGGPTRAFASVNLNIGAWKNVEIVADAHALPYASDSVDHISCLAVLEHLKRPDLAMQEMARVLKPGGLIYIETPFLQPYHGYPSHYQNFTLTGHDYLAERFGLEKVSSGPSIGPTSAWVVLTGEYLRRFMPAGNVLATAFRATLGLLLIQLDRFMANRQNAFVLSGSSVYLGRKPAPKMD